jgi:Ca-activated chloride channel family protein
MKTCRRNNRFGKGARERAEREDAMRNPVKRIACPAWLLLFFLFSCGSAEPPATDEEGRVFLDPSSDWSPSSDWAAKGTREGEGTNPTESGTYADAVSDAAYDSVPYDAHYDPPPDMPPEAPAAEDVDEEEDVEEEDAACPDAGEDARDGDAEAAGGGGGDEIPSDPYVLYLSSDDSNSQASPVIARWMIEKGQIVPWSVVRVHEFLNYFDMNYPPSPENEVRVFSQFRAVDFDNGLYALQIAVSSESPDPVTRGPMNVTFVLDTSGSMEGGPMMLEREVVRAVASQLRAGDIVSAVEWNTSRAVLLDSHGVTGPDDPALTALAASLNAGGGTDLHAGLTTGYELAGRNFSPGWLNRVILVSDGQANAGITDINMIAAAADDSEGEGIYLVGVGCGEGYNDTLMDAVTDAGKGAYIFIDSTEEAHRMFGDRFLQSVQIAARDVQVELTLPGVFSMGEFFGEEYSSVPEEVDPQHLAPDDAMVFHQLLVAKNPGRVYADDLIRVAVTYSPFAGGPRVTTSTSSTLQKMVRDECPQMRKADAIVVYAQALMRISVLLEADRWNAAVETCEAARAIVDDSARALRDSELFEIVDVLETYCDMVEES